ncbi:MAG TPA: nucleotide exchange factor GrpE [Flavobacteriales bacterium]|nr:nucleotide exchange factor GrpE [Flavobacteriales bacterium]
MTEKEKKAAENQKKKENHIEENPKSSAKKEESSNEPVDKSPSPDNEKLSADDKYAELNDRFLRLYSEFDNYKRRTAKERLDLFKTASEEIVVAMLPVLDDFDRAIKSNEETNDSEVLKEGIILVRNKFKGVLEQKGLEPMDSQGKPFDTDIHEALTKIPATKKKFKGKVMDVIEKGYLLNGKVIRYAKVVVGS